ncbi:LacI family transcriptional regulator [Nocardioides sp. OK12]|uniref:LacI family DNA-binding transcriptional regulator n=1 Tax=Nocardioides sp. OK12 TaxID=2758661 RepID=UPI0021C34F30|nr:LacI family DNA-binding transcriptional regulator [Nocardioides sp. OK12]GHJ57530.1 LacI family transcriptional regulator [Nocardioides sp. OK12]
MTSIHDLARETGVSTATVSRALRGLPRVSEETRQRVMEAAVRLGYVPSPHAVGLASGGQTRTVAIVVLFVTRWFFATVISGAEQVLRERGYDVLLYNLNDDEEARRRVLGTHLLTKRVDALLVVGLGPTPQEVHWLSSQGMPVVTVGARIAQWPSVRVDDELVARTGVEHLLSLGHRRIAYVGMIHDTGISLATPRARVRGYRDSLRDAGIEHDPELELEGQFTLDGGVAAGRRLVELSPRPTAVFCASDEMAFGVLRAARDAGLRVPEDLSVVGVDDHEMASFFDLTTIRQPVVEQGRYAARQVLDLMAPDRPGQGEDPAVAHHVELSTELVVRGTTSAPGLPAQRSE